MRQVTVEELLQARVGDEFIFDGFIEGHGFTGEKASIYDEPYPYTRSIKAVRFYTEEFGAWIVRLTPDHIEGIYISESRKGTGLIGFLNKHT